MPMLRNHYSGLLLIFLLSLLAMPNTLDAQRSRTRATPMPDRARVPSEWSKKIDWRSIGPANMMGRITSIAVYEKDPTTWWAASASGGLLKTTNNGINFEHQFDDQSTVSIGDVQVAQSDPNIVWVGTGESNPRNSVSWGDGVYKSTDGGKTWKNMGLKKTFQTGAMAIHPKNPDIVYVGSLGRLWGPNEERGLFKTSNGGKTWKKILYVDDKTGVVDVQMNPKNPEELLIATYERQRDGFDGNDPMKKYGAGSAIYKTTDGGKSFKKVSKGLPTCKLGRIGLDYYRKDPKYVYAIVESEKIAKQPEDQPFAGIRGEDADVGVRVTNVTRGGPAEKAGLKTDDIIVSLDTAIVYSYNELLKEFRKRRAGDSVKLTIARERKQVEMKLKLAKIPTRNGRRGRSPFTGTLGGQAANLQDQQGKEGFEYGGVYVSKNGGDSWTRINTLNPRPMYYSHIRVDPTDRNYVYVCGTSLYKSSDGGETFTGDGGSDGIHVDHHALWIDGRDSRHMILGNDGGIYVTYDRMSHWDHHNHVAIGQFYHVGVDANLNYKVYGGLQDNGSWGGPSRHKDGYIINSDWYRVGGGDGFVTLADPNDADQIYFESQNGGTGSINLRTGSRGFIRPRAPRGTRYRFNWKTPFILSPHNSKIYYSAGNHVFRSFNKGNGIKSISPDITNTDRGAGSALTESPIEPGVLYVGSTDGAVWMTKDGGKEWKPLFSSKQAASDDKAKKTADKKSNEKAKDKSSESSNAKSRERGNRKSGANKAKAKKPEMKKTQAKKPEMKKAKPKAKKSKLKNDVVSGTWAAKLISDRIPEDRAKFEFTLKLDIDNKVTGEMPSMRRGQPQEVSGEFNPETGELNFSVKSRRGTRDFTAKIKDGKMSGMMSAGGGRIELDFEATRKGKTTSLEPVTLIGNPILLAVLLVDNGDDPVSGEWTHGH